MKIDVDELHSMPLKRILDLALETEDRSTFWLLAGAATVKAFETERYKHVCGVLWDAGHKQPIGDYDTAFRALRQLRDWERQAQKGPEGR